jgi:DNA polymerase I-like protein with 3'-5' exonuclease and polymerase domains
MLTGHEPKYHDLRRGWPEEFMDTVNSTRCRIVTHNAGFDYKMLWRAGIKLPIDRMDCTVIRATQINEHEFTYRLEALAQKYLGEGKIEEIYGELARMFGGLATRNVQMPRISQAPPEMVAPYACRDAKLHHDLWQWQEIEIARQGIQRIIDFERSVLPAIIRNEMRGVRVDEEAANRAVAGLTQEINAALKKLYEAAGKTFNIDSPKQVREVFNPHKGLDGKWRNSRGHVFPSTPGGAPSFSAEALRETHDPVAEMILSTRSLVKTRDTFLKGHILASAHNGRVYPSIHQTKGEDGGTGTGRLSYTEPALQQIPSRNKAVAAIVKPIFLPDEGQVWVDGDMHSFEVRVFAHLVNNPRIIQAYADDPLLDFHQMTAELTNLVRNATYSGQPNAKQLNLSMIFNSGRGAIAEKMGMPFTWDSFQKGGRVFTYKKAGPAADAVIDRYHQAMPGVKELAERASRAASKFGYVETQFGRRIRFPHGFKLYKASGLTIQATAADINKMNWLLIEQALGDEGRLVLNTHDSYGMSLPEDWMPYWERVKEAVQSGFPWFRVPIVLELSGSGPNWWEALKK